LQVPVALHARDWLNSLKGAPILADLVGSLKPLLSRPPAVTSWRRLGLVIGCLLLPAMAMPGIVFGLLIATQMARSTPEISALRECLSHLQRLQRQVKAGHPDKAPVVEAFEVYVTGRFQPTITNTALWRSLGVASSIPLPDRQLAQRIIATRPVPSEAQFLEAKAAVQAHLKMTPDEAAADALKQLDLPKLVLLVGYIVALVLVIIPCLIGSLLFRGGALVHLLGLAVVRRTGSRAARWHVGWRSFLAWLPFLLLPFLVKLLMPLLGFAWAVSILITLVGALTVVSILLPERSLQDRLAGTCLVPR
jgi:hypothetical protein